MENITEFLSHVFLFKGIDLEVIEPIAKSFNLDVRSFSRQDIIYSPQEYEKKIGFVVSGQCEVRRSRKEDGGVLLNTLEQYDAFGVLALFSTNVFPTYIYAKKSTEILFISESEIDKMIERNYQIAKNLIYFMANRITFLNSKINTFSGSNVEARLASYILSLSDNMGSSVISFNCKKCAEAINAGRASVYRALTALTEEKTISFDTKKIILIDRKGLERISK